MESRPQQKLRRKLKAIAQSQHFEDEDVDLVFSYIRQVIDLSGSKRRYPNLYYLCDLFQHPTGLDRRSSNLTLRRIADLISVDYSSGFPNLSLDFDSIFLEMSLLIQEKGLTDILAINDDFRQAFILGTLDQIADREVRCSVQPFDESGIISKRSLDAANIGNDLLYFISFRVKRSSSYVDGFVLYFNWIQTLPKEWDAREGRGLIIFTQFLAGQCKRCECRFLYQQIVDQSTNYICTRCGHSGVKLSRLGSKNN